MIFKQPLSNQFDYKLKWGNSISRASFTIGAQAKATKYRYACDRKKQIWFVNFAKIIGYEKVLVQNSLDSERPLCDVNELNLGIYMYLPSIYDYRAMRVSR